MNVDVASGRIFQEYGSDVYLTSKNKEFEEKYPDHYKALRDNERRLGVEAQVFFIDGLVFPEAFNNNILIPKSELDLPMQVFVNHHAHELTHVKNENYLDSMKELFTGNGVFFKMLSVMAPIVATAGSYLLGDEGLASTALTSSMIGGAVIAGYSKIEYALVNKTETRAYTNGHQFSGMTNKRVSEIVLSNSNKSNAVEKYFEDRSLLTSLIEKPMMKAYQAVLDYMDTYEENNKASPSPIVKEAIKADKAKRPDIYNQFGL